MPGIFIQSYDCEGRWGIADHVSDADKSTITARALEESYDRLVCVLDQAGTPATFAWVGAFALGPAELRSFMPELRRIDEIAPGYLGSFFSDAAQNSDDGWVGSEYLARVCRATTRHEIGAHGFTHIPWNWPGFTSAAAILELQLLHRIADKNGIALQTFVHPRNAVDFLSELSAAGIEGFRHTRLSTNRLVRLLREFHVWERSEKSTAMVPLIPIPGGHILSTRAGGRKVVPASITLRRWKHIVDSACAAGGVAHLWCHPENFLTAPGGLAVLQDILAHVARRRDQGDLLVLTQAAYCRYIAGESNQLDVTRH